MANTFSAYRFTMPRHLSAERTSAILRYLPDDQALRILDIGCGAGAQIMALSEHLETAQFVGIDISDASIKCAEVACEKFVSQRRVAFKKADYLAFHDGQFDVVLADSVLHLMAAPAEELAAKLASDVATSGWLIFSMPYDCGFNRLLWFIRSLLRHGQGRMLDGIILSLARLLHPSWDIEMLRERVPYMYELPCHVHNNEFSGVLSRYGGFDLVATIKARQGSLGKARHLLAVYRKRDR